jgi:flagellar basal-body rod protein FlgC
LIRARRDTPKTSFCSSQRINFRYNRVIDDPNAPILANFLPLLRSISADEQEVRKMNAQSVAASGMNAASLRLEAAASNIANAQTEGVLPPSTPLAQPAGTQAPELQAVYDPRRLDQVSLSSGAASGVSASLKAAPDYSPAYKPDATYANAKGFVAVPNIDLVQETVGLISAQQSFKANMRVYQTADAMQKALLNIKA